MSKRSDSVVQVPIDRRTIAKIAQHMEARGVVLTSMSGMLRTIIEIHEAMIDRQGAKPVETAIEATNICDRIFKASLNPSGKYKKSLLKSYELDDQTYTAREVDFTTIDNEAPRVNGRKDPVVERAFYEYTGIEPPKVTRSPEEQAALEESVRKAQELLAISQQAEILTPLQIERNKAITEARSAQMDKYTNLAREAKSQKTKEQYELMKHKVAKYSQLASEGDNEALRILVDEL